jgi:hypothetical protein
MHRMEHPLAEINNLTIAEQAAWERLAEAEVELAVARAALIETTNRERSKRRTRPMLRVLDGEQSA